MPGCRMNCGRMSDLLADCSEDAFLGGKLRLRQPKSGHRAGHDAILLAAATSARSGDRVVEFGAGVGAA
jgi:tRNA1(Val) A37 N6-methylase TrmN6